MGNSYSTKRMTGSEKSCMIRDIQSSHDEAMRKRKAYLEKKEEENNSPKGLLMAKTRQITQKATAERIKANDVLIAGAKQLKLDIIELFKETLVNENGEKKDLSWEELLDLMKCFTMPIANLKTMCDMIDWGSCKNTEFDNLFYELIKTVDIRFVLVAPKNTLKRSEIKFKQLPEMYWAEAIKHFEELGLTKSNTFMERYGKYVDMFRNSVEASV